MMMIKRMMDDDDVVVHTVRYNTSVTDPVELHN